MQSNKLIMQKQLSIFLTLLSSFSLTLLVLIAFLVPSIDHMRLILLRLCGFQGLFTLDSQQHSASYLLILNDETQVCHQKKHSLLDIILYGHQGRRLYFRFHVLSNRVLWIQQLKEQTLSFHCFKDQEVQSQSLHNG